MDQSFHYLLMINQLRFQRAVLHELTETGLTPGQPKVLDYLYEHDGSMQKEIAHGCQIDPATLTGILGRMEEKGLIQRKMEKGNRRSSYVYLTEDGREKGKQVQASFLHLEEQVFDGVSEEQKQIFMKIFNKISTNMEEFQ